MEILQNLCENVIIRTIKEKWGMNRENQGVFKAIVIGAGASGLVASIELLKKFGKGSVAVFDRLDRVGKKLLQTGNGQCNLSNDSEKIAHYHGENAFFPSSVLNKYSKNIEPFFNSLGIPFTSDNDKVYPLSKQASSVVDALRFKLESLGAVLNLSSEVSFVKKQGNLFVVESKNGIRTIGENLIVCVGGKSQKHLGTDGSGYSILTTFNHSLTNLYPSIVALKTDTSKIKGLKGLKQKVSAKAVANGKVLAETQGDILFTDYGVSGNVSFYLSSYLANEQNGELLIDFCQSLSVEEIESLILAKQKNCPYLTGEHLLLGIMNGKIASSVLRNSGFANLSAPIKDFSAREVAKAVKGYKISVKGVLDFDSSQVTKGGIKTSEFNDETLESKLVKNLYACGEVLDVDGDCGGFNLKWAFASAFAVSNNIL